MIWGMNKTLTNLVNSHTYAAGGVHLGVVVLVPHRELVDLANDVVWWCWCRCTSWWTP